MEWTQRRRLIALICISAVVVLAVSFLFREHSVRKAKEDVLRQDLFAMRAVLDQYIMDKGKRPQSLNDLVTAGYFKQVPTDPMTGRNDTWIVDRSSDPKMPGVDNIHSGSRSTSREGTAYSDW